MVAITQPGSLGCPPGSFPVRLVNSAIIPVAKKPALHSEHPCRRVSYYPLPVMKPFCKCPGPDAMWPIGDAMDCQYVVTIQSHFRICTFLLFHRNSCLYSTTSVVTLPCLIAGSLFSLIFPVTTFSPKSGAAKPVFCCLCCDVTSMLLAWFVCVLCSVQGTAYHVCRVQTQLRGGSSLVMQGFI